MTNFNTSSALVVVDNLKVGAVVTFETPGRPSNATPKDTETLLGDVAIWGSNNDFPQEVIKDIRKDPDLGPLLSKAAALIYSGGLTWGIPAKNDKGEDYLKPVPDASDRQIRKWMRRSNITRYFIEGATDLVRFANAFPETILSVDGKEIVQLMIQPAEYCRWGKMNASGIVEKCFLSYNWPDAKPADKTTKEIAVVDPYYNAAGNLETLLQKKKNLRNFIYPLSVPTPGAIYYQLADWNGYRESGWYAFSQAIPLYKKAIIDNQLNIKYHVEISTEFWGHKYKDWSGKNEKEQQELMKLEIEIFKKVMSGAENAGNSLITAMLTKPEYNKEYSMWKITAIENKFQKGEFMEEMKEASIAKSAAVGLHPALVGTVANSGMGGAGSNIREAYNLANILNKPMQDLLLEPLYMIAEFNGWPEDIEFAIKNPFMTTLDAGKELTNTKPA
jgi:hypothetical protein